MKLYTIRREDFLEANTKGQIPEETLLSMGSLWGYVSFTQIQRDAYTYPIWEGF